jgi:hypothetical protein
MQANTIATIQPIKIAFVMPLVGALGFLIFAIVAPSPKDKGTAIIVMIFFLVVAFFIYRARKKVIITDQGLIQEKRGGQIELPWSDVTKAYIKGVSTGKSTLITLVLERLNTEDMKLRIEMITNKNRQVIANSIITYCKGAIIDDRLSAC